MFSQCAASTTPKKLEIHSKLTRAVAADDKKEVKKILEIAKEEEINWRGIWGNTALHWAIANSNIHMAIFLLENTVGRLDVNTPDNSGKTALHLAIAKGFDHITDYSEEKATDEPPQAPAILSLIKMTDLSIEDKKGYTPIHLAMMRRDVAVIEAMLEKEDVDLTLFTNPNSKNVSPLDLLECKYTEVRQSIDSYAHVFTFTAEEWDEKRAKILGLLEAKKIALPTAEYEK